MKENRMLLMVDPQHDFISGTLPVPGAPEAMEQLAAYIQQHADRYTHLVATSDWHPYNHCSFADEGGPWPRHCVQHTAGAAIPDSLIQACNQTEAKFTVLYKGNNVSREEYSIMQNIRSANQLDELIRTQDIKHIDICGLAGNICVLNTLRDLVQVYGASMFTVLLPYAPSLDDGSELKAYIQQEGITC